ncbi:Acetyl-CoA:oxalate CoA-transferase [Pseudomonas fluorescens]|uniref:Acetyl-CoA:oxalate CoA-transferase n=1 Tax=Pseudomonas fluorescens TaxID=294 RepID=A0A5E6SF55_PSEFL|nr:CaiB/BaiF CoA-transferase family protein [Pseudomonas fluorescens]VVM79536.1 Acetyl-CoA:oxalate CoA-transferase [Pseudomonas fluorescens]
MNNGPLFGLKVIELAQIMAGPTCGMMLADMGADVIKVEKLPGGDDARNYKEESAGEISHSFAMLNRNKRSIALNVKKPEGRDALLRMIKDADVVIENYRLGTMEKLGIGYETLAKINPGLIYCSISGYGRTGPKAKEGGFDLIAQGFAGLMSVTGEKGGRPIKGGNSVADINAGILASVGILAAYVHRLKTGKGQLVETSLFEAGLQQMYWFAAMYFATGESAGASGSAHPLIAPYQAFETADRWITLGGANQRNWVKIAEVLGHPEWAQEPRFLTGPLRKKNEEALVALIAPVLLTESADHWMCLLEAAGVPVGPVNTIAEALNHPHTLAREMVVETEHPTAGRMKSLGLPIKFSRTPGGVKRPATLLGEHSREVMHEYGFSNAEIEQMLACGALFAIESA